MAIINLTQFIPEKVAKIPSSRLRIRNGFWASEAGSCPRELYWKLTAEPETNPIDFVGRLRMLLGSAIEKEVKTAWFEYLHLFGLHTLGYQVQVGGTHPEWTGSVDFWCGLRISELKILQFLIELKTITGLGADKLLNSAEISIDYLYQLGLYLKAFYKTGRKIPGYLFYIVIDTDPKMFGHLAQVECEYLEDEDALLVQRLLVSGRPDRELGYKVDLKPVLGKWIFVEGALSEKVIPAPAYRYKYPVTQELAAAQSDDALRKAISGSKIIGDWQIRYSRYRDKHILAEQSTQIYTPDEIKIFQDEYLRRHPKSKKFTAAT